MHGIGHFTQVKDAIPVTFVKHPNIFLLLLWQFTKYKLYNILFTNKIYFLKPVYNFYILKMDCINLIQIPLYRIVTGLVNSVQNVWINAFFRWLLQGLPT